MLLNTAVALLPVLLFLLALVVMDSFKLARPSSIAAALGCGVIAALACDRSYDLLISILGMSPTAFSRYIAPAVEESVKAIFIVYLLLRRRIGFAVDAAQLGFAVGAGFAVVENIQYLRVLQNAALVLWFVRGLGTAVLHGATTSIFAMLSKTAIDRQPERKTLVFLPGWAVAVVVHAIFNWLPLPAVAMTMAIVAVLPVLMLLVFQQSEKATHEWVGAGLDLDLELLRLVSSDAFGYTRMGGFLRELKDRFPGTVVADMFCLLRLELELAIQAKAMLLAREAGLEVPLHPDALSALAERAYLRRSIGPTGLLALKPLHVSNSRDDWHEYLLAQRRPGRGRAWVDRIVRQVRGAAPAIKR
jgi:RsiW-degrading membrane proteinase PrsW (M82 family)